MLINYSLIINKSYTKVDGDHDVGSFKISFQVADIDNHNYKDNTVAFSILEAKDYQVKIKLASKQLKIQIKELQESTCSNLDFPTRVHQTSHECCMTYFDMSLSTSATIW